MLNILLISPALLLYILPHGMRGGQQFSRSYKDAKGKVSDTSNGGELSKFPIRPFITAYRGAMMIVTCLAILAVDFRVFPRRFAKVETWGTSLMDMGVGSFVFSAGLVAARQTLADQMTSNPAKLGQRLYISAKHSLPLLVLGLIRLYSVKGIDYAEHVTEYGVHWNFFFTLALLPPFVALFQTLFSIIPSYALLSFILGAVYQSLLESTSLKAFLLTAPRTDWLSKNREGIFSFFGYLAIFLAGQDVGQYVLPRQPLGTSTSLSPKAQRIRLLSRLTISSVVWSSLLFLSLSYNYGFAYRVSRRLANLPYVLWVSAFNCAQMTLFCLVETLVFPKVYKATDTVSEIQECRRATSTILNAYNRNGLPMFLLANLMTGIINITFHTINAGRGVAMVILFVYAIILTGVALVLEFREISIKV